MAHPPGQPVEISDGDIEAEFVPRGAELWAFRHLGRDLLWNGDARWWNYRAPILFPVVGRSKQDAVSIGGRRFAMGSHGFARELPFELVGRDGRSCRFEQRASDQTRLQYPFDYRLEIVAGVEAGTLVIEARIHNDGTVAMPFCFGFHPAFRWPFPPAGERDGHVCRFEKPEPGPMRRATAGTGLLTPVRTVPPLADRTLAIGDGLFDAGSLQFEAVASRKVWFGKPGGAGLAVSFPDSTQLGIWTKPGAPFFCIEPWQGLAAEEEGSDALTERPGIRMLAPGAMQRFRLLLTPGAPDPGA